MHAGAGAGTGRSLDILDLVSSVGHRITAGYGLPFIDEGQLGPGSAVECDHCVLQDYLPTLLLSIITPPRDLTLVGDRSKIMPSMEPIAIIGMSFKFPGGAETSEDFWQVLIDKRCAATEVPKDRFVIDAYWHHDKKKLNTVSWKTQTGMQ